MRLNEYALFFPDSSIVDPAGVAARDEAFRNDEPVYSIPHAIGRVILPEWDLAAIDALDVRYCDQVSLTGINEKLPQGARAAIGRLLRATELVAQADADRSGLVLSKKWVLAGEFTKYDFDDWHVDADEGSSGLRWTASPSEVGSTVHARGWFQRSQTEGSRLSLQG